MKRFVISSYQLAKALKLISSIRSKNSVLVILEQFVVTVNKSECSVRSYDLVTDVVIGNIGCECKEEAFSFCLPTAAYRVLCALEEQPITISYDEETQKLLITHEFGKVSFNVPKVEDYPKPAGIVEAPADVIPLHLELPDTFGSVLKKMQPFISDDELRPAMTGVFFEVTKNEGVVLCATDAHKLRTVKLADIDTQELPETNFILNRRTVSFISGMSKVSNVSVSALNYINSRRIQTEPIIKNALFPDLIRFNMNVGYLTVEITSRLIDAKYPDYRQVMPKECTRKATFDRVELIKALNVISFTVNSTTKQVELHMDGNKFELIASNIDYETESNYTLRSAEHTEGASDKFAIAFNTNFLLQALRILTDAEVVFSMTTPARAITVGNEVETILVMPVMINT